MIVDSSAVVAILRGEPEAPRFAEALECSSPARISAANWLEAAIVTDGNQDPILSRRFEEFMQETGIVVEPVSHDQVRLARQAYRDFGKGSGHPARLNFGDCFAYALAVATGEPLLFKGDDFRHTGIASAAP